MKLTAYQKLREENAKLLEIIESHQLTQRKAAITTTEAQRTLAFARIAQEEADAYFHRRFTELQQRKPILLGC